MLACKASADLDTELQNIGPERLAFLKIAGFVGIKQDQ